MRLKMNLAIDGPILECAELLTRFKRDQASLGICPLFQRVKSTIQACALLMVVAFSMAMQVMHFIFVCRMLTIAEHTVSCGSTFF